MGVGRDLGAALTMGLSATTKHKEAQKAHEKRKDAAKYPRSRARQAAYSDSTASTRRARRTGAYDRGRPRKC